MRALSALCDPMDLRDEAKVRIPIAQLQPSIRTERSHIFATVALIWPYSSSQKTISLLLVEPDFRLRRERGQAHVRFFGSSAKALASSRVQIGDEVLLNLEGVEWAKEATTLKTAGRGVEWALQFQDRLVLEVIDLQVGDWAFSKRHE